MQLTGKKVLIKGYRGDGLYRLVRVLSIRDTHKDLVKLKTKQDNVITRGRYLLVGMDLDRKEVRSYYVSHTDVVQVGWFGTMLHKVSVVLGWRETK